MSLFHARLSPFSPAFFDAAPIYEMATFYGTTDAFMSNAQKFMDVVGKSPPDGLIGGASGEVIEMIDGTPGKVEGKVKAVTLIIQWESVEKHMAFRGTTLFKENIHYLREGAQGVEMHHAAFTAT